MDDSNIPIRNNKPTLSRRRFVKTMTATGAALFLGKHGSADMVGGTNSPKPPRSRILNPYINDQGKPQVVIVSGTDFGEMLRTGLDTLGGLNKLITDNQDVLIKPNCNASDIYPAISDAPAVAELAREVISATNGHITVGDRGYHTTSLRWNVISDAQRPILVPMVSVGTSYRPLCGIQHPFIHIGMFQLCIH
ncbi:twin-arginine translocation signal domain-containing protein [bacterium]